MNEPNKPTGKIGRPCAEPRCPNIIEGKLRYCPDHAANEKTRGWSKRYKERLPLYSTKAWRLIRLAKLALNLFCEECARSGHKTIATDVHHLKSAREFPHLALDINNLESLCERCHNRESQRESQLTNKAATNV